MTLGVVPDYLFSGTGMRIDGVVTIALRPGGMKKGDVVIRMGDHDVNDMMGYMEGLAMFEEGQVTQVEVKRGEDVGPRRHLGLSIFATQVFHRAGLRVGEEIRTA